MSISEELEKLHQLHGSGAINDDEYARAKSTVLGEPAARMPTELPGLFFGLGSRAGPLDLERQTRHWAMFLHFSLLAGYLLPLAGFLLPILIWQLKKEDLPGIDRHGRSVVNWMISEVLYFIACVPLVFVIIGVPLLIALVTVGIIFPLVAGIKANNGVFWHYPLSIPFIPVELRKVEDDAGRV